jgi:hypothetical protein
MLDFLKKKKKKKDYIPYQPKISSRNIGMKGSNKKEVQRGIRSRRGS